jgi:uncharacterized protein YkwD
VALVVILLSAACTPQEEKSAYDAINTLRSANNLPALSWNSAVYSKAVSWSNHMADEGQLSHSLLSAGVPAGWTALGENVAVADTVEHAIKALEGSPPHRANMLNPSFRSVAVGVADRSGRVWVTEVFVG